MNDSPVTERMLERLRLGELTEAKTAEVIARLEAAGETYRLEQLIDEDEQFLQQFPAAPAAAEIRAAARRRARFADQTTKRRKPSIALVPTLIAGTAVVVVLAIFALGVEPPQTVERRAMVQTDGGLLESDPTSASSSETRLGAASPTRDAQRNWDGLLDWVLQDEPGDLKAIACSPAENMVFEAKLVERISIDQSELLSVRPTSGEEHFIVTCQKAGLANMNLLRADGSSTNVIVRVAEPYSEPPRSQLPAEERLDLALAKCGELTDMALQVVVERVGYPSMIIVGGGSKTQRECIRATVKEFDGFRKQPETMPPFMLIERSW